MKVLGLGSYIPERTVTNEELSTFLETSDEWITERVGIKERRVATFESNSFMATEASKRAVEDAKVDLSMIDLIIVSTVSSDNSSPCTAAMVQKNLGVHCPAFDISAACSGFIFLLDVAESFLMREHIQKILIISSERLSRIVDWTDRSQAVIFGDGAAALVVGKGDDMEYITIKTFGGDDVIRIPNSNGNSPFYTGEAVHPYIYMNGAETYKFAVRQMMKDIKEVLTKTKTELKDLKYIIPHQANLRIIEAAKKRLDLPADRFVEIIQKTGNTSAASIPLAMDSLYKEGKLVKGDKLLLTAFGGGLSSAACLLKF